MRQLVVPNVLRPPHELCGHPLTDKFIWNRKVDDRRCGKMGV